jgi:hypothetical protein
MNSFCQLSILYKTMACQIVQPCIKDLVVNVFCAIEECLVYLQEDCI